MRQRPDMIDDHSPRGLEVFQLTHDPLTPASHVYPEAQVFTSDGKRFVLHWPAYPHHGLRTGFDQPHRYYLCDLEAGGSMTPLTDEPFAVAPSVSPCDRWLYYFVDEGTPRRPRFALRRVGLDGTGRQTIAVIDTPFAGTPYQAQPGTLYPISTIRSDGGAIAISAKLEPGKPFEAAFGLIVIDTRSGDVSLPLHSPTYGNLHAQYSRSTDAVAKHDIMIQEDHGPTAALNWSPPGRGIDIHVIRDDGTHARSLPWGRDQREYCSGHQCWWGRSDWAIGTMCSSDNRAWRPMLAGLPGDSDDHEGRFTRGAVRNQLDAQFPGVPCYVHMAVDIEGRTLVTDAAPFHLGGSLWVADLPAPGAEPATSWRYLLSPRSSFNSNAHIHPSITPDGRTVLFNSDRTGTLQAYIARGW